MTTGTGLNFRVNPATGAPIDGDAVSPGTQTDGAVNGLPGGSTGVTGAAYTNSFAQSGTTVSSRPGACDRGGDNAAHRVQCIRW